MRYRIVASVADRFRKLLSLLSAAAFPREHCEFREQNRWTLLRTPGQSSILRDLRRNILGDHPVGGAGRSGGAANVDAECLPLMTSILSGLLTCYQRRGAEGRSARALPIEFIGLSRPEVWQGNCLYGY